MHPESVPPRRCVFFAPGYKTHVQFGSVSTIPTQGQGSVIHIETL